MRQLKQYLRNRKAKMLGCGECKCQLLNAWRCGTCDCTGDSLMNGLSLDEPMLMSAMPEEPVVEPKKKRSRKKKVEEAIDEDVSIVEDNRMSEANIPEILSLDELSK